MCVGVLYWAETGSRFHCRCVLVCGIGQKQAAGVTEVRYRQIRRLCKGAKLRTDARMNVEPHRLNCC